jgi:hypothetical protein
MKTLKLLLSVVVGLGAMSVANATTFHLGNVDGETRNFGDFISGKGSFKDIVRFHITEQSGVDFSFMSFYNILAGSLKVSLQERVSPHTWENVSFGSPSFVDLSSGAYRWVVTGTTGKQGGFWDAKMTVAAVPEADVWMMLLVGVGLVGYQLRRKQQSIKHPPFAV